MRYICQTNWQTCSFFLQSRTNVHSFYIREKKNNKNELPPPPPTPRSWLIYIWAYWPIRPGFVSVAWSNKEYSPPPWMGCLIAGELPENLGGGVQHTSWPLHNMQFSLPFFWPVGSAVASWLVRRTPDRMVQVSDLAGHCVVFLGKTLNSHSASLYPGGE